MGVPFRDDRVFAVFKELLIRLHQRYQWDPGREGSGQSSADSFDVEINEYSVGSSPRTSCL